MTETNIAKIEKYKSWGFNLTPAAYRPDDKPKDKKPVAVKNGDGKWKWNIKAGKTWSDDELVAALETKRLAVYHNPSKYNAPGQILFDAESDDKTFRVNRYLNLFPDTFTIGKKVNGVIIPTHKLYAKPNDVEKVKQYGYDDPIEGKKVELLCSGVSVIDGLDRIILDSRKPTEANPEIIKHHLQFATFLAEIEPLWPVEGGRDEAHFLLAGALAKHTDLTLSIKKKFIKHFLEITNDEEVNNRLNKYEAQEEAYKNDPAKIVGIDALAKKLGGNFKSFDELKREDKKDEEVKFKPYPLISSAEFTFIEYPPVEFVMEPIFTEKSTNQIYGGYGSGKTLFGLALAMAMASGLDFLDYKCHRKITTLYVEGELPANDIRTRRDAILQDYFDKNKDFDSNNMFQLTKDDLEMHGFEYGFDMIAVSRNMSDSEAKDYGRKGRELIEDMLYRIEQKTGQKPFFFLDNITALADIDENRSTDWTPITAWLTKMKTKGFPSCFFHHSNKQSDGKKGSSGSSSKERLLDTSIQLEELKDDQRFDMGGNKNLQTRITFDKARNFGGAKWDLPYLLTMNENGVWTKYPDLKQQDFKIIELWKKGIRSVDELAKDKEITLAKKTIYSHLKILKDQKLISDDKPEKEDF